MRLFWQNGCRLEILQAAIPRAPGQGVWEAIAGPLAIEDSVVKGSKGGCPPGMAMGGSASLAEVFEVLVIAEYPNWVSGPLHIHPPLSEGLHNSQQLLVIDSIV